MAGPWLRVQSIVAPAGPGTAGSDFLAVLPAASLAARRGRPFVACWLCRARGAPLEFITNAVFPGPALAGRPAEPRALLFPPGARGVPAVRHSQPATNGRPLRAANDAAGRTARKSPPAVPGLAGARIDWTRSQGPASSSPKTRSGATMRAYQPTADAATDTEGSARVSRYSLMT